MLYKTHQTYKPTTAEKTAFEKAIEGCNYPLTFQYAKEKIKPSHERDESGRKQRNDMPRSISIQPHFTMSDPTHGSVEFRYAKSRNPAKTLNGNPNYTPSSILILNNHLSVKENDWDLAYFLLNHPKCGNGMSNNKTEPYFILEKKVEDAIARADKDRIDAEFATMLYNTDFGLSEEQLRDIALAYHVPGSNTLIPDQLRTELKHMVSGKFTNENNRLDSIKKFMELTDSKETLKLRGTIQRAVDLNYIGIHATKRAWMWKEGEDWGAMIVKTAGNKSNHQSLYEYLETKKGKEVYAQLIEAIEEAAVVA